MYILKVHSVHCTLRQNPNLKKFPSNQINDTKNALFFFFCKLQLISFTFNLQWLYALKHKVCLSKLPHKKINQCLIDIKQYFELMFN